MFILISVSLEILITRLYRLTNKIMLQNLMLQLTDVRIWQVKNLSDKEYEKSCNHVFHWGYEN